jgi:salicylate hydroxylase
VRPDSRSFRLWPLTATGLRSEARKVVLQGKDQPPQRTGFAAYRAVVDVEKMRADPDVAWLLEKPGLNCW